MFLSVIFHLGVGGTQLSKSTAKPFVTPPANPAAKRFAKPLRRLRWRPTPKPWMRGTALRSCTCKET